MEQSPPSKKLCKIQKASLTCLPTEILIRIAINLPSKDILTLAQCCSRLAEVAKINQIWQTKSRNEFGINLKMPTCESTYLFIFNQKVFLTEFFFKDVTLP